MYWPGKISKVDCWVPKKKVAKKYYLCTWSTIYIEIYISLLSPYYLKGKYNLALHTKYFPRNYFHEKVNTRPKKPKCLFPIGTNLSTNRENAILIKELFSSLKTGNWNLHFWNMDIWFLEKTSEENCPWASIERVLSPTLNNEHSMTRLPWWSKS